jgi:hypothetical protein
MPPERTSAQRVVSRGMGSESELVAIERGGVARESARAASESAASTVLAPVVVVSARARAESG